MNGYFCLEFGVVSTLYFIHELMKRNLFDSLSPYYLNKIAMWLPQITSQISNIKWNHWVCLNKEEFKDLDSILSWIEEIKTHNLRDIFSF